MHPTDDQPRGAAKLPHSVLDTTNLPAKEGFSAWRESIGVIFDVKPHAAPEDEFHARVEAFLFSDLALGVCSAGGQVFDRSRRRIACDNLDHVMLQFYTRGSCSRRGGGPDEKTSPGDLWISDLAQPLATTVSDFENINLILPRRLLAPHLKAPDEHQMRVVPRSNPLVGLLFSHLQALFRSAPQMTQEDAQAIVRPTLDLAAAALNGRPTDENAAGVVTTLLGSIVRHVEARLPDPHLSAEAVAAAFGISLRKLHYLFEPRGGFTTYVRHRRVFRCHEALADPEQRHRSIADIAEAHGFTNPNSFSRTFRQQIGITAREVRSLAARRDGLAQRHCSTETWWSWIERMR